MIPTKKENPKGLHAKYFIEKANGEPMDENAEYFVMRLDRGGSDIEHIAACRIGVHAYADAIENKLPELAKDLRERYPLIPNKVVDKIKNSRRDGDIQYTSF